MSGKRLGTWFTAAVIASFAAGVAAGLVLPRAIEAFAGSGELGPNEAYVRELTERYGLDTDQMRLLRMVLESRERELASLDPRSKADESRALAVNLRAQERIKYVLNGDQRARFLHDSELDGSRSGARPGVEDAPK